MSDELKPCPWPHKTLSGVVAGLIVLHHHIQDDYQVWCPNCEAYGPIALTEVEAVAAWNCRFPDPALTTALTRVKELETGFPLILRLASSMERLTDDVTIEAGWRLDCVTKCVEEWQDWLSDHEHVIDALEEGENK